MKIKYILSTIAIVAISKSSFAQYAQDAIRFSTFQTGSSSRIKALGNANVAVGGDITSVGGNPAGLGFFTRTEYSLTPEFNNSKGSSTYLGQASTAANKNTFNLNNASVVFYNRVNSPRGVDKTKGWLSVNFGLGYARTNNFNENIYYTGKNNNNSINDYYASLANSNGVTTNGTTLPDWAYNQNLIDQYGAVNPTYQSNAYPGVNQSNSIFRTGGQSEFNFALGANYSNKLYLGFGVALTDLNYSSVNTFNETGRASVLSGATAVDRNYNSTYIQDQITSGSGVNAKLGLMYKFAESVRFGALFTSPTFLSVNDSYTEGLSTTLTGTTNGTDDPQTYDLNYTMRTPFKVAGGLSVFVKQFGFITGDVEYVDYSSTRINSNRDYSNSFDNNLIKSTYRGAINARVGAEARLTPSFLLRGGYGMMGSPLKQNGSATNTVSGGLGYRFSNFYVDATYTHVDGKQTLTPYTLTGVSPSASLSRTTDNVFLTLGFRY